MGGTLHCGEKFHLDEERHAWNLAYKYLDASKLVVPLSKTAVSACLVGTPMPIAMPGSKFMQACFEPLYILVGKSGSQASFLKRIKATDLECHNQVMFLGTRRQVYHVNQHTNKKAQKHYQACDPKTNLSCESKAATNHQLDA